MTRQNAGFASTLMGGVLTLLGLAVLMEAALKLTSGSHPEPLVMGWIGLLALVVNVGCLRLLLKHRDHDINTNSACSRNDIIANGAVLASTGAVAYFGATWPGAARLTKKSAERFPPQSKQATLWRLVGFFAHPGRRI